MIKEYENGTKLVEENEAYLDENRYLSLFFFFDAPILTSCDSNNFALKVSNKEKELLCMSVDNFSILLYGDESLTDELVDYLLFKGYRHDRFLCSMDVGDAMAKSFRSHGLSLEVGLGMDFMVCDTKTIPTSDLVEKATIDDIQTIYEYMKNFIIDCHLEDTIDEDSVRATIEDYRILREDGKIISMAKIAQKTDKDAKLTCVYTPDEFRGKGYARIVVNAAKNEIIDEGLLATLNVDKLNPISNHIYESLGFTKLFSQAEYRLKVEE